MSDDSGTDLEQRVEKLEEKNQQLAAQLARYLPDGPSRRDVLKYGATAFAAAGLGSAATGAALGADTSVGNVGTTGSPVDVYIDEIRDHGGDVVVDIDDTGALSWNRANNFLTVNGAEYASQHSSAQAAIDAAGVDGTVVFDAAGAPYSPGQGLSPYDGQTIFLEGNIEENSTGFIFDFNGITGATLVPNGNKIDGMNRSSGGQRGVVFRGGASDCSIDGVLRVSRFTSAGVEFRDATDCTAETVIGNDIGDYASNSNIGDTVNFGSNAQATECHVGTVISNSPARHAVAFGSQGPEECTVETVHSNSPGGAHLSLEYAVECSIGTVIGRGARDALNQSGPEQDYSTYPEVALLAAGGNGSIDNTIETVDIRNPVGGSGEGVGFGNSTDDNAVRDLISVGSAGNAIEVGRSTGDAQGNHVGIRRIENAGNAGAVASNAPDTTFEGIGRGLITECSSNGVAVIDDRVDVRDLDCRANLQGGSGSALADAGVVINQSVQSASFYNIVTADGSTGSQTIGIYDDGDGADYVRFVGCDTHNSTTPWDVDSVGANSAKAANTPSPTL